MKLKQLFCRHYYDTITKELKGQERNTSDCDAGELFNVFKITEKCAYCDKVRYRDQWEFIY